MKFTAFWFRRDLRLEDNAGLYHALKSGLPVLCFFIFDKNILDLLSNKNDARVQFIFNSIFELHRELKTYGSSLIVGYDTPENCWKQWIREFNLDALYCNRDYESYPIERDKSIASLLSDYKIQFHSFKDHVIFEKKEVCKTDGSPYTVFTPYKNYCINKLLKEEEDIQNSYYLKSYPSIQYVNNLAKIDIPFKITLKEIGFRSSSIQIPAKKVSRELIKNYHLSRDTPSVPGTSKLGIHFRFGTISIREKARLSSNLNLIYLNELLWRDFYSTILQSFPYIEKNSFKPKYDQIEWINNEIQFRKWCEGKTGFPIVDAGMRELNETGFMHNRVRMITASFLVKNLLIDWRWGEAYFAEKLLDYDLASNNGGWQWVAGCGTDSAPYFRIFNPIAQQKKFDPNFLYIKKWIPEFDSDSYPQPIIDLKLSRDKCLYTFQKALQA